jgi:hypothetical protein
VIEECRDFHRSYYYAHYFTVSERKSILRRPKRRRQDDIKTDLQETEWVSTEMARDVDR